MRYATPPPPPFGNYSFSRRMGRAGGDEGRNPTPRLLIICLTGEQDAGGGMRYAAPPPRLLIIHLAGERDPGRTRDATPAHPPVINYSLSRRMGHGENEVCNPHPPRLLIIHSAGERDPGRTRYATPPHPPFINYSLSGMRAAPLFFRLFTHLSEGMRVGMSQ